MMTDECKPEIERLFAAANRELADEAFVAGVMARTGKLNARNLAAALVVCLAATTIAWLLAEPLNTAFLWATALLSQPIAGDGNGIGSVVLPVNSVGGALALAFLAVRMLAKRLFGDDN